MYKLIQAMLYGDAPGPVTITYYPYRQKHVVPFLARVPYHSSDDHSQKLLAKLVGRHPDNHTAFTIKNRGGELHFGFSDNHIMIGTELTNGDSSIGDVLTHTFGGYDEVVALRELGLWKDE